MVQHPPDTWEVGAAYESYIGRWSKFVAHEFLPWVNAPQHSRYVFDAAAVVDPAGVEHDESLRFPLCQPEPLRRLFEQASLASVEVRAIEVPTVFVDFEDYWNPFLAGQGPAPAYLMSLDE